jgi:outer membrane protein assembly factor BamB
MRRKDARPTSVDNRPLRPPRRVFVGLASLATATVLVRAGLLERVVGSIVDWAVVNIITLILAFSALMSVLVWFLRESGHSLALKRAVGWGLLAAVGLALAALRIERVSGDLVPEFRLRWSLSPDRTLPAGATTERAVRESPESWSATPADFPRFLGPRGTAGIDAPTLDPDWEARPPKRLWRRPIGAGWGGFAVCGDHAVTLEQRGDSEVLSCRSVTSGETEWTVAVPGRHETVLGGVGPRSTPTIDGGVVYATGATGWLLAVDGGSGKVLWKKDVLQDAGIDVAAHQAAVTWGRAGSPLVTESLVIVPGGGPTNGAGSMASLLGYAKDGASRPLTCGGEQISYVSPQLTRFAGRDVLIAVNESAVVGYDPGDGRQVWRFDWPGHSNSDASCSQPHVIGERRIFISKGYGIGAAVFEMEEKESDESSEPVFRTLWQQPGLLKTKFTNVTIHDGHAYGLSDGILECVSLAEGKRRWTSGRYGQGQLLRVGSLLLVQAESGEVVLVDCSPQRHVVRARLQAIAGQTWNNPCLSGNRLLVRNCEEAACYELPLADAAAAVADGRVAR